MKNQSKSKAEATGEFFGYFVKGLYDLNKKIIILSVKYPLRAGATVLVAAAGIAVIFALQGLKVGDLGDQWGRIFFYALAFLVIWRAAFWFLFEVWLPNKEPGD